jgi:plastocyanin
MIGLLLTSTMTSVAAQSARETIGPRLTAGLGHVEGTVTYDGPLPDPLLVPEAGTVRHLIEVDTQTKGLKDAVVWLEGVSAPEVTRREAPEEPVVMDQQNYFFVPHVLAVETGWQVEFRNSDVANHGVTACSLEPKNAFNVTTPQGGRYAHRFIASKTPVAIGCPIHGTMAAWVFIFDHRFHAVTDPQGRFRLPPVPPGRYTLRVHHPDGGMRRREGIVVRAGEPVRLRIEFHGDQLKAGKRVGQPSSH